MADILDMRRGVRPEEVIDVLVDGADEIETIICVVFKEGRAELMSSSSSFSEDAMASFLVNKLAQMGLERCGSPGGLNS